MAKAVYPPGRGSKPPPLFTAVCCALFGVADMQNGKALQVSRFLDLLAGFDDALEWQVADDPLLEDDPLLDRAPALEFPTTRARPKATRALRPARDTWW